MPVELYLWTGCGGTCALKSMAIGKPSTNQREQMVTLKSLIVSPPPPATQFQPHAISVSQIVSNMLMRAWRTKNDIRDWEKQRELDGVRTATRTMSKIMTRDAAPPADKAKDGCDLDQLENKHYQIEPAPTRYNCKPAEQHHIFPKSKCANRNISNIDLRSVKLGICFHLHLGHFSDACADV